MADYAVVNLETTIGHQKYTGYPCFHSPESYVDALMDAGFDMFLTANNHTLDRNSTGVKSTIEALDSRHLDHIGTYESAAARIEALPMIKNINNIKIGFLNYTYGTNGIKPGKEVIVDYIDRDLIRSDVEATRAAGAEAIVVCIHWGDENIYTPNSTVKSLAEYLKSLDVDVIIGGHPHVVQPVEMTVRPDGRPQLLYYSLGNFISNMKKTGNRGGMLARVTFTRGMDGRVRVTDTSYRLVYTVPPANGRNYRLVWAKDSDLPQAKLFLEEAQRVFDCHNIGVSEDSIYNDHHLVESSHMVPTN